MSEWKKFSEEMPQADDKIMMEVKDCICGNYYYRHVHEGDTYDGFSRWRYASAKEIQRYEG